MRLDLLLNDLDRDSLIELFGGAALAAAKVALTVKSGKPYVHRLVRDKPVQAKREERLGQRSLQRRTSRYRYSTLRLCAEYPATFGRNTSRRAIEIAITDSDPAALRHLASFDLPADFAS